jgi:SulP family sulfate permease
MLSFSKLLNLMTVHKTHLIVAGSSPQITRQFLKGGLLSSHSYIHYFKNLNDAMEWCEDQILHRCNEPEYRPLTIQQQLNKTLADSCDMSSLLPYMERLEVAPGHVLMFEGAPANDFFFIESGKVICRSNGPTEETKATCHLETMKNGRVVGDISFFLGHCRTAEVIAAERSIIYRLSNQKIQQLEEENPAASALLHKVMVCLLAERVTQLVKTVNALQQ